MLLPWILVFLVDVVILEWFLGTIAVYYFYCYLTEHNCLLGVGKLELTNTWVDCVIMLVVFLLPPLLLVQPVRLFVSMYRNQHRSQSAQHYTTRETRCLENITTPQSTNSTTPITSPTIYDNPTNIFLRLNTVINDTFQNTVNEAERNEVSESNIDAERNNETPGFAVRRLSLFDLTSLDTSLDTSLERREEPPPSYSEAEGLDCPPPDYSQVGGGRLRLGRFVMIRDNKNIKAFRV